ncbi:uncharacterized protein AB675_10549 [Cyphellophora attinorum]|uniref:Integral membrane protein n=1 Tax=Cyphellophora attinorum TaxID=1664694 RepID=A0A0N0NMW2_9EURO|nr:uncharacterized protein AB675_10549 [Phialophora attinorum]KPI40921.1 hypothetical protein AB675_10549 [Phialophora attinorum]
MAPLLHREHLQRLKPVLRAYAFSYAFSTGPRLFGLLLQPIPNGLRIIVAGPTITTRIVRAILQWLSSVIGQRLSISRAASRVMVNLRFICTFFSAWLAFDLLNRDREWSRKRARSRGIKDFEDMHYESPNKHHLPPPGYRPRFAGKTSDFTLFALVRALDVLVIKTWIRTRSSPHHPEYVASRLSTLIKKLADPSVFATSAAIIMWAWFYSPERLPRAYNKWISTAANIDPRLITALRRCREGEFIYGQETGQAPLLTSLCDELGLPQKWGDPSQTIPIPCELYHCGAGPNCEVHALSRFLNGFKFSMALYLPLQLLSKIRTPTLPAFRSAFTAAARSSSFLAAFISLFYYAVCLARTRLGPRLFSPKTITPQMWDSGLCTLAGCLACGWSILLEKASRRQEIAFFVAPKALSTLLPRVYEKRYQRREQVVFAVSVAVVLEAASNRGGEPVLIRGVLGKILGRVLKQ